MMECNLREVDDIVIVDLEGRLVAGEPEETLRGVVDRLVADDRRKILLNLSSVPWMDSSGIGEIVASVKLADRFGGKLKLLRAGDRVRHVLSISRLLPVLDIYEDEAEALESFDASDDSGS